MNLQRIEEVELIPPPEGSNHRFKLTSNTLYIIGGSISVLLIILFVLPFDSAKDVKDIINNLNINPANSQQSDTLIRRKIELVKYIQEEKKDFRDFYLKLCQIILLNLLLPIITAMIGYKVGANANQTD